MTQIGTGDYRYEVIRDFLKMPPGESLGIVSRVATDSQDRIYVFQRKNPPVVVFDPDGKYLGSWGSGEVTDPHGLKDHRRCRVYDRPLRLGREVIHARRQAAA
jgi:hypothetical protein